MTYRVITRWTGRQWIVRVEDERGHHRADTSVLRLAQTYSAVRAELGEDGDLAALDVEVQLHPEIEFRFRAAERICADASREVDNIVKGLTMLNVSAQDIAALLEGRPLRAEPRRPLVAPNAEIAACGLDCRPEVIAVRWEDRGRGVTTYCRNCVDKDRSTWKHPPHGTSALIYEGPVVCDVCGDPVGDVPEADGDQ